jgi:hypothetical protein
MTKAFVIGNGTSRAGFDLGLLRDKGIIYGCNRLYQDTHVDVLVSVDPGMSYEIQDSGYSKDHKHYCRYPRHDEETGALDIPPEIYGWSSGPAAVWMAAQQTDITDVYLLGFDFVGLSSHPSMTKKANNMYAGTEFYITEDHPETYFGNWVQHVGEVHDMMAKMNKNLYIVGRMTNFKTDRMPNLIDVDYEKFRDQLNT